MSFEQDKLGHLVTFSLYILPVLKEPAVYLYVTEYSDIDNDNLESNSAIAMLF